MYRFLLVTLCFWALNTDVRAEDAPKDLKVPRLTTEELENYQFEVEDIPFKVSELTVGQLHILKTHRADAKAMFVRHLGILNIQGNKQDIVLLQQIIDRRIIKKYETRKWQALGVLFGDVLANEFNMTWVRYEDRYGLNKALRWRKTDNFMFPLQMFSKRIEFNEKIKVAEIYDKINTE